MGCQRSSFFGSVSSHKFKIHSYRQPVRSFLERIFLIMENGQTAYRILVASDLQKLSAGTGNLWDSGRRHSPDSSRIPCLGKSFQDGEKAWWKVQVWNSDETKSEFSEPSLIQVPNSQRTATRLKKPMNQGGGSLKFIDGRIGKALRFGPKLAKISSNDFPELRPARGTTIATWIRPEKITDNWQCIFRKEDGNDRKELLTEVAISGNPERGKEAYHRKSTACTICHQIGTGGGLVGPELSSIGAYAQPAAILDSILSPSSDIKQGYETVLVTKQDDTIVAGIFQRRSDTATLIRETTNKIVPIPNGDVKKIEKSPVSLMPPGLTLSLRRDEIVDLLSFLVSLDGTTEKTERDE